MRFEGLAPRSRTSSFALKGKLLNIRQAGRELVADYIVEGSVLRSGERLRINAQLIRTRDDFPVWSGKFDREASDAFGVQDQISRTIVNNLPLQLGRVRRRSEVNSEATDLYLRAHALGLQDGVGLFQEAIIKDPSLYARAYLRRLGGGRLEGIKPATLILPIPLPICLECAPPRKRRLSWTRVWRKRTVRSAWLMLAMGKPGALVRKEADAAIELDLCRKKR